MKGIWWKSLAVVLVVYTIVMGFLGEVPAMNILHETIRNLYFHVTMWFAMMIMMTISLVNSIRHLNSNSLRRDTTAAEAANTGMVLGTLGLITGSFWARFTWGAWWTNDPQLNGAAITMLSYLAYAVLRNAIEDREKKARISAVYNIFAYTMMVVFIGILPKVGDVDSLHPGKGGNPGFNSYDLDSRMRMVFYPAIIGWTLFAWWITTIRIRVRNITNNSNG
ncbi:MAG: cytochrome c biogenesis protein CcsA [Flavobacteriales bacterium]|nr:cytochrome c biogenesis protein CcsA [Flavobacteriales bacterium]MCB9448916.1 cytochrome c biogenesis protein CcsA [Flavobacteriales bacterium]